MDVMAGLVAERYRRALNALTCGQPQVMHLETKEGWSGSHQDGNFF